MKVIVGLGNPGRVYANSRHNVGFRCLNHFAKRHGLSFDRSQARSRLALGKVAGEELVLAKPRTFMNLCGQAVAPLVGNFGVSPANLVVIYDDLDLPLGRIRIRERGSSGGHKGMKSIIDLLGSRDFPRIRVGIGCPEEAGMKESDAASYVLGDFAPQERPAIEEVTARVADALDCILSQGIAAAMNRYNSPVWPDCFPRFSQMWEQ